MAETTLARPGGERTRASTEVLAGLSTFVTLSYIFVVNPSILASAGFDFTAVFFATVIASAAATLLMGAWARLPFALAPGMEMNGLVAFFVVGSLGFGWQDALGLVFWSGVLMIAISASGLRGRLIDAVPDALKIGLSLTVGFFLVAIALRVSGVVVYDGQLISGIGTLVSRDALFVLVFLPIALVLDRLRVPGSVLITIVVLSVAYTLTGDGAAQAQPRDWSNAVSAVGQANLLAVLSPAAISAVIILFVLDFYGSVAKFIGLTHATGLQVDGKLPRRRQALLTDGAGTVLGSLLGTSNITTYVESAVGIGVGGRTGLTALVVGGLTLCVLLAYPLVEMVPLTATLGALVYVAFRMVRRIGPLDGFRAHEVGALAVMPLVALATFAVDTAFLAGILVYGVGEALGGRRPHGLLLVSGLVIAASIALQILAR
ncbi:solute carrier family 23 protein [Salinarimonas sp. NSM]|uniref:solute carrier family 23 protein n=1 Tax=Salinarimonas sp. NSM TaxID=3458003 RepID=UPI0040354A3F